MELTAEPGLFLMIYAAQPGSPSRERLDLLASLAATDRAAASGSPDSDDHTLTPKE